MVNEEDLLKAIGRAVRESDAQLERDVLLATAATPPVAPTKVGSSEPLVDALVAQLAQDATVAKSVGSEPKGLLLGFPRKAWIGVPVLAAAAGLSLLLGRGALHSDSSATLSLRPYAAEIHGSVSTFRSEQNTNTGTLTLAPGTELTILLRPDSPIAGEVSAVVGVNTSIDSVTRRVEARQTTAVSGSLRLAVTVPSDLPKQGNICTAVGRPELLDSVLGAPSDKGEGWQRFCWPFVHIDRKSSP